MTEEHLKLLKCMILGVYNELKVYLQQHLNTSEPQNTSQSEESAVIEVSTLPEPEFALNEEDTEN